MDGRPGREWRVDKKEAIAPMSEVEENNRTLARSFVEAQANADLHALDEMLATDFVNHNKLPSGQESDRESYKRAISAYHAALSESHMIIED
jgi:hypothetical protein